ncbi:MAG: PepSY domain-containing protein [Rhodospirillaceae bacterium]|nr:PepSY domain-containing protein [Rhodospirillaceae bacterium]
MRNYLVIALAIAGIGAAAPAFAGEHVRCRVEAGAQRLSHEAVSAKLAANGYKVTRIKSERGCYEVRATDKSGARVELKVDPVTAAVLRTEQDD